MDKTLFDFCKSSYKKTYAKAFSSFCKGKAKAITAKTEEAAERHAQKEAIRETLKAAVETFPSADISEIWKNVYKVHIYRKSGLRIDEKTVAKIISAEQSWRKSSGHAFEDLVTELTNLSLIDTGVRLMLQRDLNTLIKSNGISNEPRDIAWLEKQIANGIFDLYAVAAVGEKTFCFGCIQCKTSIRDRVTRDREPSIHAMQSYFWSACVALDGEFLNLPKFRAMVNGGSSEFVENGWPGMYVLSEISTSERIYHTGFDLDLLAKHAVEASRFWLTQRQWFDKDWKAGV